MPAVALLEFCFGGLAYFNYWKNQFRPPQNTQNALQDFRVKPDKLILGDKKT